MNRNADWISSLKLDYFSLCQLKGSGIQPFSSTKTTANRLVGKLLMVPIGTIVLPSHRVPDSSNSWAVLVAIAVNLDCGVGPAG